MQQPIQVDTITSFWDIAGVAVDSFAALGAVGALLVAAFAYRRQVDDARTAQASKVLATVNEDQLVLRNFSGLPVYELVAAAKPLGRTLSVLDQRLELGGDQRASYSDSNWHVTSPLVSIAKAATIRVTFTDAAGVRWARYASGRLVQLHLRNRSHEHEV